ncbi:MAG: OmpW/AlkL family protein, partial [bacterium]
TYMIKNNIGVELLAATPFSHDIVLEGTGKIAETDHLPPTLSLQYHFAPESNVRPYVGAGVNWTTFFDEEATAVISDISLDDSVGWAVQVGVDVDINEKWFFNADIRKLDIETTAETDIGNIDVTIDPVVVSLGVGLRF